MENQIEPNELLRNSPTVLFTLVRNAQARLETSTLSVSHLPDLSGASSVHPDLLEGSNLTYEFDQPYFCCTTHLNDLLVLGGENKCALLKLSNENHAIRVAPNGQLNLKSGGIVRSIKFSNNGRFLYCGTSLGEFLLLLFVNF